MNSFRVSIKGMVCNRCILTVTNELQSLGMDSVKVSLGEAVFSDPSSSFDVQLFESQLSAKGFTLMRDRNVLVAEKVKELLQKIYSGSYDFPEGFRLTKLISEVIGSDNHSISNSFIAAEHKTIEQYMIEYRINKVKEFLLYTNHTLADIAFSLNFNSVAHLSSQFKQQTGLTPSYFKELKKQKISSPVDGEQS